MVSELVGASLSLSASDLYEYADPLVSGVRYGVDAIEAVSQEFTLPTTVITNPPFNSDFPQRLVEASLANPTINMVCILQRLTFMESQKRFGLFSSHPPSIVAPFSSRFSCQEERFQTNPIGGQVSYAWYVWDKSDTSGITKMRWIDGKKALSDWRKYREEKVQDKRSP
jgi:hypothetical protein